MSALGNPIQRGDRGWRNRGARFYRGHETRPQASGPAQILSPAVPVFVRCNLRLRC